METILLKEKLIELVRKHECLYNTKHKHYKNRSYKLLLWEKIGTTLEIDGNKAKEIWRSLRDGYIRYKKNIAGKTGSGRKTYSYMWSAQMAFLDGTLELRPTSTNITAQQEVGSQSPESQTPQVSPSIPLSPQPGPSYTVTTPSPETPSTTSSIQYRHANKQSLPTSAETYSVEKRSISSNLSSQGRADKVLEYLQNKNRERQGEYDEVDHLFISYAKTFKKLSRITQFELKVTLAKLFAEAEKTELDSDIKINESSQSEVVYLSPADSIISDASLHPIILAQEMSDIQQPITAMDLSETGQSTTEDLSYVSSQRSRN